jgi:hypothetical protein
MEIFLRKELNAECRTGAWDECPAIRGKAGSEQAVLGAASWEVSGVHGV